MVSTAYGSSMIFGSADCFPVLGDWYLPCLEEMELGACIWLRWALLFVLACAGIRGLGLLSCVSNELDPVVLLTNLSVETENFVHLCHFPMTFGMSISLWALGWKGL